MFFTRRFGVSWYYLDRTLGSVYSVDDRLTFSPVCIFVATLTLPILPAPRVFCNCQSPTVLPLGFSLPFLECPPLLALILRETAAAAASSLTSRIVGSCGVAEGNELVWVYDVDAGLGGIEGSYVFCNDEDR